MLEQASRDQLGDRTRMGTMPGLRDFIQRNLYRLANIATGMVIPSAADTLTGGEEEGHPVAFLALVALEQIGCQGLEIILQQEVVRRLVSSQKEADMSPAAWELAVQAFSERLGQKLMAGMFGEDDWLPELCWSGLEPWVEAVIREQQGNVNPHL